MAIDVNELFEELGGLPQVEAIALGGSRATGRNDEKSDYDVYVYVTGSIDENERRSILDKYCGYMEIGNSFWELEDDVTLKDGIDMDIIYRNMEEFEGMVSSVVTDCVPWNGYTTCMWHNLITSKIVLDKQGKLNAMQEKYRIPYPKKLKENIIFALNEMTHPGEKRMQSICSKECSVLPHNFDENLNRLFDGMFRENIAPVIHEMVEELKKVS